MTITTVELLERLTRRILLPFVEGGNTLERVGYVNPDGPEAATLISNLVKALEEIAALSDRLETTCSMDGIEADRIARTALRSNLDKEEGDNG